MTKEGIKFHLPSPENLTVEQRNLISIDLSDPKRKGWGENMIVQGYGGTGKTVVAYYRALGRERNAYNKYNGNGSKVMVLCFNRLLNSLLNSEKDYPFHGDIMYLQDFYHKIRRKLIDEIKNNGSVKFEDGYFSLSNFEKKINNNYKTYEYIIFNSNTGDISEIIDDREKRFFANQQTIDFLRVLFKRYVEKYNYGNKIYKEIIIDEGQDISGNMLKSIQILTDHISIFADDHQNTQGGSTIQEMKSILCPNGDIEYLTNNMRTTKEIFEYAVETFLLDDEPAHAMKTSKTCISIPESKPDRNSRKEGNNNTWINNVVELVNENEQLFKNILIVCPTKQEIQRLCSALAEEKISHGVYYSSIERDTGLFSEYSKIGVGTQNNILVTTYISAKGLEAECVIIYISKEEYNKFINGESGDLNDHIFYTLSTRPRRKLLFVTNFPLPK